MRQFTPPVHLTVLTVPMPSHCDAQYSAAGKWSRLGPLGVLLGIGPIQKGWAGPEETTEVTLPGTHNAICSQLHLTARVEAQR